MGSPASASRYRLFIFDADDTLRRTVSPGKPCPHNPNEWVLLPGVREVLTTIPWGRGDGPRMGIASNQDQVGYGQVSLGMAKRLLRDLVQTAAAVDLPEPALQLCPHRLDIDCSCRKPKPGMLLAIMSHYGIEPADTLFVGNHQIDREAAARAGTAFRWAADFFKSPSQVHSETC